MSAILAEIEVDETHMIRVTFLCIMLVTVYHKRLASTHNHVIDATAFT